MEEFGEFSKPTYVFERRAYVKENILRDGTYVVRCVQVGCTAKAKFRHLGQEPHLIGDHVGHDPLSEDQLSEMRFKTALRACCRENPALTPKSVYDYVADRDPTGAVSVPFSSKGQAYIKGVRRYGKTRTRTGVTMREANLQLQSPGCCSVAKDLLSGSDFTVDGEGMLVLAPSADSEIASCHNTLDTDVACYALNIFQTNGPLDAKFLLVLHEMFLKKTVHYFTKAVCIGFVLLEEKNEATLIMALEKICPPEMPHPVMIALDEELKETFHVLKPEVVMIPSSFNFIHAVHTVSSKLLTKVDLLRDFFPRATVTRLCALAFAKPTEVDNYLNMIKESIDAESLMRPALHVLLETIKKLVHKFSAANICMLRNFASEAQLEEYIYFNLFHAKLVADFLFNLCLSPESTLWFYLEKLRKWYNHRHEEAARLPFPVEKIAACLKRTWTSNETARMGLLDTFGAMCTLPIRQLTQLCHIALPMRFPDECQSPNRQDLQTSAIPNPTPMPSASSTSDSGVSNTESSSQPLPNQTLRESPNQTLRELPNRTLRESISMEEQMPSTSRTTPNMTETTRINTLVGSIVDQLVQQLFQHPTMLQLQHQVQSLPSNPQDQLNAGEAAGAPSPPQAVQPIQANANAAVDAGAPAQEVQPIQADANAPVGAGAPAQAVQPIQANAIAPVGAGAVQPIQANAGAPLQELQLNPAVGAEAPAQAVQPYHAEPEIPEDEQCIVCRARRIRVVLIPCGHLFFCAECAMKLNRCPLDRSIIEHRTLVHH